MSERIYKKRIVTLCAAFALVLTVVIGGTLAYLSDRTDAKVNKLTFVSSNDPTNKLSGLLEEVWTAADGLSLIPGDVVTKKPSIKNNSTADQSEWASIQVVFEKIAADGTTITTMSETEVSALLAIMEIDYNVGAGTTNWTKESTTNGNKVRYYYNGELVKNASTSDLFTKVTIKGSATNAQIDAITTFAPGGINIRLEGAVVQYQGLTFQEAQTELNGLLPIS